MPLANAIAQKEFVDCRSIGSQRRRDHSPARFGWDRFRATL